MAKDGVTPRDIRQGETMLQVAKLYYMDDLSQQQISEQMNMSRSNVSRILNNCRKSGLVEVRIHEAALRTSELRQALMERFSLREALIAPREDGAKSALDLVSRMAADYMEDILADNMTVGIGWGATIHSMVSMLRPATYYGAHAIQLIGGTDITGTYTDSVQLALDFARKIGAAPHILHAPLLVSSKAVRDLFIEENSISRHLKLHAGIDAAAVTVSTNEPERSTLVSAGYLTRAETQALCDAGLYTHILGQHIDGNGALADIALNDRVVGINLNVFKSIPLRMGVALGDYKARQILAALRGGYFNVLVTDEPTALCVLQLEKSRR